MARRAEPAKRLHVCQRSVCMLGLRSDGDFVVFLMGMRANKVVEILNPPPQVAQRFARVFQA